MKFILHEAPREVSLVKSSDKFKTGMLYRCVRAANGFDEYRDAICWKQDADSDTLDLRAGRIYAILAGAETIAGARPGKHPGLVFSEHYHFDPLPAGSRVSAEIVEVRQVQTVVPIV